ncbi:MAG TPA: tetratricopeptide repeat-containing protein [Silvibacterium sp.]|nr:tetratricopeptide repeat-containing protein [Silvibacterium sp.]
MPIRVCFMVMPFGTKPTGAEPGKGPAQIDFNALWDKALRPMIENDLGFLPIRADQDAGSLIIQAMIERLAISDLVIADMTIPNANVYYEVGVRHAAQRRGCVLIAADWSKPLFDVAQMRRLTYAMPESTVTDDSAPGIREALKAGISQVMDFDSPVYQAIPQFPGPVDISTVQSFRDVAERLARIQSEVSVARSMPSGQAQDVVKKLADTYGADAVAVPTVALEILMLLRDTRQWPAALSFIEGLPQRVREMPVIREQRSLVLSKNGQPLEAIAELEALIRVAGDTSERSGLVGGRYKALYENAADAQSKSIYLNKAISSYYRGMMLDLNDYYPSSNLPRLYRERGQKGDEAEAMTAAQLAMAACRRSLQRNPADPWALPTLLGAAFDSGDIALARSVLDRFQQATTPPFEIESTIPDLRRSLGLLGDAEAASALAPILAEFQRLLDPDGTVTAVAGRRIDAEDARDRRFPPGNEKTVARRISNMLVGTASTGVASSAACGADILTLECAGALSLDRRVVLPFPRERFRSTSVADRGEEWGKRFDAILAKLRPAEIIELNLDGNEDQAYAAANQRILEEASKMAVAGNQRTLAAIIWNGVVRGTSDLTDAFRQLAVDQKMEIVSVPTL